MIRHIAISILILSAVKVSCQEPQAPKKNVFELGFNLYAVNNRGRGGSLENAPNFYHHLFNGIYAKIFHGKNGARLMLSYYRSANYQRDAVIILARDFKPFLATGGPRVYQEAEIRLGYQRMLSTKRFAPYFFADVRLSQSTTVEPWYCPTCTVIQEARTYVYPTVKRSAGILSGLGLRLNLCRRLFLNAESGFEPAGIFIMRQSKFHYDHFDVLSHPLTLTIGATL